MAVDVTEVSVMESDLEARFDTAMMDIYVRARKEVGYNATRFLQMLHEHRGLGTARILVLADKPSDGYTALWMHQRLDLTVEALVVQPQWEPLFANEPELLAKAQKRLDEYRRMGEARSGIS